MFLFDIASACGGPCYCEHPEEPRGCICDNCAGIDLEYYDTPIDTAKIIINWGLLTILVIGIIL